MKVKVRDCWTACQNGTTRCCILSTRSDSCCVVLCPVNIRQYAKLSSAAGGRVVTVKAVRIVSDGRTRLRTGDSDCSSATLPRVNAASASWCSGVPEFVLRVTGLERDVYRY